LTGHGLRFYLLADDGVTLEPIKLAYKVDHYARHTPTSSACASAKVSAATLRPRVRRDRQ